MGQLETGGARRFRWRAAALKDGTSLVTGDCQARICEGLGVKFPGLLGSQFETMSVTTFEENSR